MRDEQGNFGVAGVEEGLGYTPMPDPHAGQEEDLTPTEVVTSSDDIPLSPTEAARALFNHRRERGEHADALQQAREARPVDVERRYVTYVGEDAGKVRPDNETIEPERGAKDLTNLRNLEAATADFEANQRLAETVDALRAGDTQETQ